MALPPELLSGLQTPGDLEEPLSEPQPPAYSTEPLAPGKDRAWYIKYLQRVWNDADEAIRDYKAEWEENWALYYGAYDWGRLEGWQSKMDVPLVSEAVDFLAGRIKQGLVEAGSRILEVEDTTPAPHLGIPKKFLCEGIIEIVLQLNAFATALFDGVQFGALSNLVIFKIVPRPLGEIVQASGIALVPRDPGSISISIEAVDPRNYRFDPDRRGAYSVHRSWLFLHEIAALAEAKDAVYDAGEVDRLKTSAPGTDAGAWGDRPRLQAALNPQSAKGPYRPVELREFYLHDVVNDNGAEVLHENVSFVLADNKYLIRGPVPNTLGDPYIAGSLRPVAGTNIHGSIITPVASVARTLTSLFNVNMDAAYGEALPIRMVNIGNLDSELEIYGGFYPGKTFRTVDNDPPVTTLQLAKSSQEALQLWEIARQIFLSRTQSHEYARPGAALSPREQTLGEFRGKVGLTEQQQSSVEGLIEERILEPLAVRILELAARFIDNWMEPIYVNRLGFETCARLQNMTVEQRREAFGIEGAVRARGLSAVRARAEKATSLRVLGDMLRLFPPQWLLPRLKMRNLLEQISLALGLNPEDLLIEEQQAQAVAPPLGGQMGLTPPQGALGTQAQPPSVNATGYGSPALGQMTGLAA